MKNKVSYIYFDIGGVFFNWRKTVAQLANHLDVDEKTFWNVFVELDEGVCAGRMSAQNLWREYKRDIRMQKI